jgi:hypothetical protein
LVIQLQKNFKRQLIIKERAWNFFVHEECSNLGFRADQIWQNWPFNIYFLQKICIFWPTSHTRFVVKKHCMSVQTALCIFAQSDCHLPSSPSPSAPFLFLKVKNYLGRMLQWEHLLKMNRRRERERGEGRGGWWILLCKRKCGDTVSRRKIRLIEGNAKCRYKKNWPVKGLRGRCLSEFIDWR